MKKDERSLCALYTLGGGSTKIQGHASRAKHGLAWPCMALVFDNSFHKDIAVCKVLSPFY